MTNNLYEVLKRFEGQPVKVFTDDGRKYTGIVLGVCAESLEIIDKCGRLILIELKHVDAIEEPQMDLRTCCKNYDDNPYADGLVEIDGK